MVKNQIAGGGVVASSKIKRRSPSFYTSMTVAFVNLSIFFIHCPSSSPLLLENDLDVNPLNPIAPPIECSRELDLYCPYDMKCCPTASGYACLGSSEANIPLGSCCEDVEATGCSIGYTCAAADPSSSEDELALVPHCQKQDDSLPPPRDTNGIPIELEFYRAPRYHLCPAMSHELLAQPHGLNISLSATKHSDEKGEGYIGQLAYFSNMGSIDYIDQRQDRASDEKVTTAIIAIHGASRVAANYMCSMIRAVMDYASGNTTTNERVSIQDRYLVLAPWFMAPSDGEPKSNFPPFLKWDEQHPIEFSFRYGAESVPNPDNYATISSFGAMDILLETLTQSTRFANLKHIVIVGHSAGGQFVHRWVLSSNRPCLDGPHIHFVVANPRSYTYLDARRYFPLLDSQPLDDPDQRVSRFNFSTDSHNNALESVLEFRSPTSQERDECPIYDNYIMGLQENPHVPAPYFQSNIDQMKNITNLLCRYSSRGVIYLSGERDADILTSHHCNEVGYHQGMTRSQRSKRFYASIQVLGEENQCTRDPMSDSVSSSTIVHQRMEVKNVGHDHALVFVSSEGQMAMFNYGKNSSDEMIPQFSNNVLGKDTQSSLIHDDHGRRGMFRVALLSSLFSFLFGLWVRRMFLSRKRPEYHDPSIDSLFSGTETTPLKHPQGHCLEK
ncbi:hypothetical protein ACHAWX_007454 [Stephanocyclus meneghinianus]